MPVDFPAAFFRDPGRSNGMALNTAILFVLLGTRLALPPRVKA